MGKTIIVSLIILFSILSGAFIYNLLPEEKLPENAIIDSILVLKSKRVLIVFSKGQQLKTYSISLGTHPIGPKEYEGDRKTPEGTYYINDKNPNSSFHKNLGISYPNSEDSIRAQKMGKQPGNDIKIHGLQNGIGLIGKLQRTSDWTAGCIAVTNAEIDELFEHTPINTPIEIKP